MAKRKLTPWFPEYVMPVMLEFMNVNQEDRLNIGISMAITG